MNDAPGNLDNVKRIDSLGHDDFYGHYARLRMPVIIRNTQREQPISRVRTEGEAVEKFGEVSIQVQQNYTSSLSKATPDASLNGLSRKVRNEISLMRLSDYSRHVREQPDTDLLCVEYPTPPEMLSAMEVPAYCTVPWSAEKLVSFTFVANKGNYAHLHFDGDFRHVLLYQVFGRKRIVMVPLAAQDKISPSMNFSNLLIQNMGEEEKQSLFRYLGAYDCILDPGEMIYFPPSIWHYVEYLENGMSINIRFGRDQFAQKVVDANRVPFYPDLHLMLARFTQVADESERGRLENLIWTRTAGVLGRDYESSRDRHRAVLELYRSLGAAKPRGPNVPVLIPADSAITEAMAVERYDSPSRRWREELMLGAPL
jgi:lysine-specific demethylase 8